MKNDDFAVLGKDIMDKIDAFAKLHDVAVESVILNTSINFLSLLYLQGRTDYSKDQYVNNIKEDMLKCIKAGRKIMRAGTH